MNKLYLTGAIALSVAFGSNAQTADNFTVIKDNTVTHTHDVSGIKSIQISEGKVKGTDASGTELFNHNIADIDEISFADVPVVDGKTFSHSSTYAGWKELAVSLTNGQELTVTGVKDIDAAFQKHLFTAGDGKVTFKGLDGDYTLYYKPGQEAFWLENRAKGVNDGVIYLFGAGFGHAGLEGATAANWAWNTPQDIQMANKVGDGVYEVNLYLADNYAVKFFHQVGWGGEYGSTNHVPYPTTAMEMGWAGDFNSGHFSGDFVPGSEFTPGVYTIHIDVNKKLCALLKDGETAPDVDFNSWKNRKINGTPISNYNSGFFDGNTVWGDLTFTQGQEVTFEGFAGLKYALSPDYFEFRDGKIYFKAPTSDKEYRIYFSDGNKLFYAMGHQDINQPEGLWLRGWGIAHPFTDSDNAEFACKTNDSNNWHKEDGCYEVFYAPQTSAGVYEATLALGFLGENQFQLRVFANKWDKDGAAKAFIKSGDVTIVNGDEETFIGKTGDVNFGIDDYKGKFQRGTYHIKIDTTTSPATVTFTKYKAE